MNNQDKLKEKYAIQIGNLNLLRNLIKYGASISAKNNWDKTTMDIT